MTIYIAKVNSEGHPESMWTTGVIPDIPEGVDPHDSTKTIVHLNGPIEDLGAYIAIHYRKDGNWVTREASPSEHHHWKNEAWVLDVPSFMEQMRSQRNYLLQVCDWTQSVDSPLSDAKKAEWVDYRQVLRTVPRDNSGAVTFEEIAWPTQPS